MPLQPQIGETAAITVRLTNIGESDGTYLLDLMIDSQTLAIDVVSVEGETSKTVSFSATFRESGTYTLKAGQQSMVYTVTASEPTSVVVIDAAPASSPETSQPRVISPDPPITQEPASTTSTQGTVVHVWDGDTIDVDISGYIYTVRYIGIDTPESGRYSHPEEPYGPEASTKNEQLVSGRIVTLEKDISEVDQYGRLLRYVYVGDTFVNAELVRLGYAEAVRYDPDIKYAEYFEALQTEAKADGRGLWGLSVVTGTSDVQISYIFYDGGVYRTEADEYVEITNAGTEAHNLQGWVLRDISEGYPSFTFPSYVLAPGATIRVYTNEYHPEYGGFSFGSGKAVWNNSSPDTAALYDSQGREVSRRSY